MGERVAREPWVDALRTVSSSAVVLFHLNEVRHRTGDAYSWLMAFGYLGVPAFFVISGYCVMMSVRGHGDPLSFIGRRLFRVFPPYWASLVLVLAVAFLRWMISGVNDVTALPRGIVAWGATLVLATEPVTMIRTINWVYWTLSYEVAFYIVMTLAVMSRKFFAFVIGGVSIFSIFSYIFTLKSAYWFFVDYWPVFAIGVSVAHCRARPGILSFSILTINSIACFVTQPASVAWTAGVTALLIFGLAKNTSILANKLGVVMCRAGSFSYSLYLIHVPVGIYLIGHFIKLSSQRNLGVIIASDVCALAVCVIFASIFSKWIESPAQNAARRLFSK